MDERSLGDVGEWGLIEAIRAHLDNPPRGEIWSGDDAAVVGVTREKIVFTTDVLVEGIDFDLAYAPADSVGAKAIAANASDVAAMGGRPRWAVAAVTLRAELPEGFVDGLTRGMAQAAGAIGAALVGGDISEGREVVVSVAMVGVLDGRAVTRHGARVGDLICVTGALGGAAGGLLLLRSSGATTEAGRRLVERQLRPRARTAEGPLLAQHATAMIDVSDGLAADLAHILDASGVGCRLHPDRIPIDADLEAAGAEMPADLLGLALAGGEDFELLFTVDPRDQEHVEEALEGLETPWSVIGEITENDRLVGDRNLDAWKGKGWEHLRTK
ncbi:MAG: thiamine-phosphate kinase [Actinomycetota bacterium]|nr:thiamine-phosphate kinase [Actinomycetota bacterium]